MPNTLARALFITVSPHRSVLGRLHVTSDIVNCEMFADDTTLDTSDTDPVSVENQLQKGINTVSDSCRKNAMVLHLKKTTTKNKNKNKT